MSDGSVVVAGAGPHALTACAYLAAADATLLDRLVVVDPQGWLVAWNRKLEALGIEWLRSSCVHHPDPDPFALVHASCASPEQVRGPYKTPSRVFFDKFCRAMLSALHLRTRWVRDRVVSLQPDGARVHVGLESGRVLDAERVVMATNPRRDHVPAFAAALGEDCVIAHSANIDVRTADVAGRRVAVVGGGLTAVQLALGAVQRGARVSLFTRRLLRSRTFDVTPGWMTYKLDDFIAVDDTTRRGRAVRAARGRGTVPADDLALLAAAARQGCVEVCEAVALAPEQLRRYDAVWLATGSRPDLDAEPALRRLRQSCPLPTAGGLPVLDAWCRWPGTEIHLMGELSALQTGPLAPNLAGARIAAERIAAAAGRPPAQYPVPAALR